MPVSVTLKLATSLDGRIALADGTSQWITGSESRAKVHEMRSQHDAVLVGIGTALADDPMLTARTIPQPETQPVRIVADSHGRLSPSSRLANSTSVGSVVCAVADGGHEALEQSGVSIWRCGTDGRVEPRKLLDRADVEGIRSIFLEGGGALAASFVRAGLVNTLHWFRAPILIGGDGLPALGPLGLATMSAAPRWRIAATARIGDDVLDTYVSG